ncbi:unnamed protein product [Paramecium sonneborni]|uniref:Uncharacterized protein n=1 Tax=Paramecium sonneborni TaxID=65129 RepID=A0A8S1L836_9CILI|nr:unnamed protein product [Paramecium sonneborni]
MRGFLSLAKTIIYQSSKTKPTQQIKVQFRLANQLLASQFKFCSSIELLRLNYLQSLMSCSLQEDLDEEDLDTSISKIISVQAQSKSFTI